MSQQLIKFKFDFPGLADIIDREKQNIQMLAAATLQTQRAMIFDAEGAFNGRSRWEPLKLRTGMILSRAGGRGLRGSIAPRNDGKRPAHGAGTILVMEMAGATIKTTIGSSLIYAEINDQGGQINAKPGKMLKIPVPMGKWANDNAHAIQKRRAAMMMVTLKQKLARAKTPGSQQRLTLQMANLQKRLQKRMIEAFLFRPRVNIPARTYTDFNDQDRKEINDTLVNYCESILTAAGGGR